MRLRNIVPNLVALFAVVAMVALAGSPPAHAGGKNQIRGVAIRDEAGATTVRIQGSGTPTFTVYKLERPTRVVVDVAQATLDRSVRGDEPSATFAVNSWSVSQVAAMAMEDGSTSVRVVVTLARPGRYDVKADGKDVVVKVFARDAAPPPVDTAALESQLEAARAEARAAQKTAEIEQQKAKEAVAAAAAAKKAADDASKAAATASTSQKTAADQRLADAKAEAARARAAAEKAEANAKAASERAEMSAKAAAAEVAKMKSDADAKVARMKSDADAKVAKAKTDADAEIAKARAAVAEERAAVQRDREAAAQVRADAERTMADAKAKLAKVEADRKRVEAEAKTAERARDDAKAAAARAEERERTARMAEEKAAAERKAAQDAVAKAEAERTKAAGASTDAVKARAAADDKIKDAEARLARAEAARVAAENARKEAEKAAGQARTEAERATAAARKDAAAAQTAIAAAARARSQADAATREAMQQRAAAESQRAAAEQRKADTIAEAERAETRRAQAEAEAARAAENRRAEEAAAREAANARKTEEAAAAKAANARKNEEDAAARARAAREAEEQAMQAAAAARTAAEARKQAAERAADEAERAIARERDAAEVARDRKRAAEDAEAEARAAARRKASADDIAAARAEAARLVAEREKAERELAERSREVARTKAEAERLAGAKKSAAAEAERLARERAAATAEVARLKQAAADARDARAREEARLAEVTKAREAEEKALAQVRAKPAPVVAAPAPVAAKPAAPVAAKPAAPAARAPAPLSATPGRAEPERAKRVERAAATIAAVRFAPADNEHTVVVDIDGKGATAELVRTGTRKAELVVHGATLPADLARTLDTTRFGGPIRAVSSYTDPKSGDVRVVVELTSEVTPRFDTSGGDLRLAFAASSKVRTQSVPGPVVGGFGATSTPVTQTSVAQLGKKKVYRGPTIELDFKDADIHDLLRTLADVGRVNIVVPEEVRAQVTVRMKRVPWDQALDVILASKGLGYRKEGNLYRVAPQKQLDAEDEAEAARLRALVDMEAPKPEVYTLNYTDAESVKPTLEPLLSPKGKIEVDKRTNSIVVNDVSRNRREIIDLATRLDTQTPQISIEARIVEARSQFERQIGIQWGGRALAGAAGGNATGLIFPSTIGLTGGSPDPNKSEDGVAAPADFAVNLPANGTNGAIGLTLGSVGGNVNINLRLSALEETGTVRIISAPKVTVLNNIEAEMKQGVKIPISIVSAEGTQTQFVRAELSLKVTPYVSQRDCAIMMDVQVTKDEPDFVNTGARGDPTILNKEAKTRMLVNDGETSVMGGIYTRNSGLSYSKVPLFGDIPVIGWLFKKRTETDDRAELLIFITPKITNKASLRCAP